MIVANIQYRIDWSRFRKGQSFFVPCIDSDEAKRAVRAVTKRLEIKVLMKVVVEDGVKGLRVWRL